MDGVDTNDLLLEPDRDAEAAVSAKRMRYTWAQLPAHTPRPSPRCSHSATAVPGGLLIYGGGVATPGGKFTHCGDAWLLDEETARWRELEMDDSCARRGHTSVYDARREQLVVFGGVASYDATVGGDGDDVFVADASKLRIYDVGPTSLSLDATPASGEAPGPRRAIDFSFGGVNADATEAATRQATRRIIVDISFGNAQTYACGGSCKQSKTDTSHSLRL